MDGQSDLTKLVLAFHIEKEPKITNFIIKGSSAYIFCVNVP